VFSSSTFRKRTKKIKPKLEGVDSTSSKGGEKKRKEEKLAKTSLLSTGSWKKDSRLPGRTRAKCRRAIFVKYRMAEAVIKPDEGLGRSEMGKNLTKRIDGGKRGPPATFRRKGGKPSQTHPRQTE